ncbi:MAG: GvpL/GvpF family gas vesicle protein [Pseudomonadota bacterium]
MSEFLGFTDRPPGAGLRARHGLAPSVLVNGMAAVRLVRSLGAREERVDLIAALRRDEPRFVPLSRATLSESHIVAIMRRNSARIAADLTRLTGLTEVVVTLTYPRQPLKREASGGVRYLADRAEERRSARALSQRAFDHLAALAAAAHGAHGQQIVPFLAGADLALLVEEARVGGLRTELARHARQLIPGGGGARCVVTGPFPPFSFVTPLDQEEEITDVVRNAGA